MPILGSGSWWVCDLRPTCLIVDHSSQNVIVDGLLGCKRRFPGILHPGEILIRGGNQVTAIHRLHRF